MPITSEASNPLDVLVVEDDPEVRDLIVEHLQARGCRVTGATNGGTAVDLLTREPSRFAIVITDLQLPVVDGLGVLRAARQANSTSYVVLVTGYASLATAIEAVRFGAYDYLPKPFTLGQLDLILERVRDRQALEAENRRLLRQLGHREPGDTGASILGRLEAIDGRLARIEIALRTMGT